MIFVRLRIAPVTASFKDMTDFQLKDNIHLIPQSQHVHFLIDTQGKKMFTFEEIHAQKATATTSKDMSQCLGSMSTNPSKANWNFFHINAFSYPYIMRNSKSLTSQQTSSFHLHISTVDTSQYWPFAWEYIIWNAAVTAVQFWMADLKPPIFSNTIACVHAAFFYSDITQQMHNLPEETLLSCFMTTLNATFETEFAQEDKGYKSQSENLYIPTPLCRTLRLYHVSTREAFSFNPADCGQSPTTLEHREETSPHRYRCCSSICYQLVFTSFDDETPVRHSGCCHHSGTDPSSPVHRKARLPSPMHHNLCHFLTTTPTTEQSYIHFDDESTSTEEHFPTEPLDDEVWSEDPTPDRSLCIHDGPHRPNLQCSYPCPYITTTFRMDLPPSIPQDTVGLN